jgi:putative ABC transport system permease protein
MRDIAQRKVRTMLVSISIFVGVLGVVTLTAVGDLLIHEIEEEYVPEEMPMMGLGIAPDEGVDETTINYDMVLSQLATYPGATIVQGVILNDVYWREPDGISFVEAFAYGFSDPLDAMSMEPMSLVDGRFPEPNQQEIIIERRMAEKYDLSVGDSIIMRVLSQLAGTPGTALEVPEETWTVTGIVFYPYGGESPSQTFLAHPTDVMHLGSTQHYTYLQIRFDDFDTLTAERASFEAYVSDSTPLNMEWSWIEDPKDTFQEFAEWTDMLRALAMIGMLVSAFLVVTVVSTIVTEQRRQIGVMKSLGATRLGIFSIYAGTAIMYGLIGTIPGILLGVAAGYGLAYATAPLVPVVLESFNLAHLVPAILIGATMGIVTPLCAAFLPVLSGTNVTILDAISDVGISTKYGGGLMSRLITRLPLPVTMRQALANIYQKKRRLMITFVTLFLAAGAFMGVAGVFISLTNKLDELFETYNAEVMVTLSAHDDYDYDAVGSLMENELNGLDGVYPAFLLDADIVLAGEVGTDNRNEQIYDVSLTGFDPADRTIQPHLKTGAGWNDDIGREGIVIASGLADEISKGLGDVVILRYQGYTQTVEIIGIDKFPADDTAFMRWQDVAALAGENQPNAYWLRFSDRDISSADVDQQIGILRESLVHHGVTAHFNNLRADQEEEQDIMTAVALIFNVASLVMAAVGAIGLLTVLSISVFERQREIGVMRSIGASSWAIVLQFLTEGVLIGMLAWLTALPLSYVVGEGLTQILPVSEFGFDYPIAVAVSGMVGMFLIALLAGLWPSLSAARRTVSDTLRYQ